MKPLVLVTADVISTAGYNWHAAIDTYLKALANVADVQPVILPDLAANGDYESLLARVDGVLLTGSKSNVFPQLYGATPTAQHEPYDHDRDATTLPLIRQTIASGTPLLAICRGLQELNVALGGTLDTEIQEQQGRIDHRAPDLPHQDMRYRIAQSVKPVPDGLLARIVGNDTITINSLHRQAIARLADGLRIEATADDGIIEAVSVKDAKAFALGVQWHPEYWAASDAVSRSIFEYFGNVMRGNVSGTIESVAIEGNLKQAK
tara:strand:+ start:4963 stop:5751 length:789 start_codon:yes stop_codon:yes gene_type:complete